MKLKIKRAYDVADKAGGFRVLVDRLWPRGVSKERIKIDLWAKDAALSTELRVWFHADSKDRFREFSRKYARELSVNEGLESLKNNLKGKKIVTFITAAKDTRHSHIPTLLKKLKISPYESI